MGYNESKTRTWDRTTPNDGLLFEAEFQRLYDNFIAIVNNGGAAPTADMMALYASIQAILPTIYIRGLIVGGLLYRDSSHWPYIMPGTYEVYDGTLVKLTSVLDPSSGGLIGDASARAYYHYYIMMNNAGSAKLQLATGHSTGKNYNVNSITGGNTINVDASAGGVQPAAGMIAVLESLTASGEVGFYPIASVVGSPVTAITLSGSLTNQGAAAGTCKIYYPHSTLHGAGTAAHITTMSEMLKYTPAPDDDLYATAITNDWAGFNKSLNGYYSKFTGYTGYRILGAVQMDGAAAYLKPFSYRAGRDKNDNFFSADTYAGLGGTDTKIVKYTNLTQMFGNDYTAISISANGTYIKADSEIDANINASIYSYPSFGDASYLGLSLNSAQLTTAVQFCTMSTILALSGQSTFGSVYGMNHVSAAVKLRAGDIVRPHSNGMPPGATSGKFTARIFK